MDLGVFFTGIHLVGGAKGDQVLHWDGTPLHQPPEQHLFKSPCFESCQCPSLLFLQPYKESSLADTDGIVAVGHEGVGEQLLTHPVDLIQGATTIQMLIQLFKAANYDNKYSNFRNYAPPLFLP